MAVQILAMAEAFLRPSTTTMVHRVRRFEMMSEATSEAEVSVEGMEVVWLNEAMRGRRSLGEHVQQGDCCVVVPNVASADELRDLFGAGLVACDAQGGFKDGGKNRFSVSDPASFGLDVVESVEQVFLRVLDVVDDGIPSVYEALFRPGPTWAERQPSSRLFSSGASPDDYLGDVFPSLRELYMAGELEWSEGEPAINVYTDGGGFGPHKDHMALSVLVPLTDRGECVGGGTGYWSSDIAPPDLADGYDPGAPPTTTLAPPLGSAILFGGDVTHAGMPVIEGLRSVLVASFSTRTPESPPDRVNGLQQGSGSGALRGY